jgi:hypothetical protein
VFTCGLNRLRLSVRLLSLATSEFHRPQSGWEGIYSNLCLLGLMGIIGMAAEARKRGAKSKLPPGALGFLLTRLLRGSLAGTSTMALVTCLSLNPRNCQESYLSLKYGAQMAQHSNLPAPQPTRPLADMKREARSELAHSTKVAARGVVGKYAARRTAEVRHFTDLLAIMSLLRSDEDGAEGEGKEGGARSSGTKKAPGGRSIGKRAARGRKK